MLLITVCIVMAYWATLNPLVLENYGFRASSPVPITWLTNQLIHANVIHLMGNMVFLAAVGVAVETATGSLRFALVYFLSGFAGVVGYWLAIRNMVNPPILVGASGSIAGCATYYSLRYTRFRVPLAPKRSSTVAWITIAWVVFQVAGAVIRIGEPVHVSGFLAHLSGALCGLVLGLIFRAPDLGSMELGHQVYEALNDRGPVAQVEHLKAHLESHPEDYPMMLKLAEGLRTIEDSPEELRVLFQALAIAPAADAAGILTRIHELGGMQAMAPLKRRQLADQVEPSVAQMLLDSIIELPKEERQRPEAMLDKVRLLREINPEGSKEALDQLVREYPQHPAIEVARTQGWFA